MALLGVGLLVSPAVAHAKAEKQIPCTTAALIDAMKKAEGTRITVIILAANCTYDFQQAEEAGTRGGNALPIVHENVTLQGRNTELRRSPTASARFRIAEVAAGGTLTLRGVTISGGDSGSYTGGGLLSARGTLRLIRSLVTGNTGDNGAGISNDRGRLTITASTISDNTTGTGGGGGGIYNDGSLRITDSTISANNANTTGGGLHNEQEGDAVITSSVISDNRAGMDGGGIYNGADSTVILNRSVVVGNTATAGEGGGVYNLGRLCVRCSRICGNNGQGGGGVRNAESPLSATNVENSVISGNHAPVGSDISNEGNSDRQVSVDDASVIGGNMPDGGVPDGGMPDGGVPDGGMPDGGVPDGGMPDGGMPDGGMS